MTNVFIVGGDALIETMYKNRGFNVVNSLNNVDLVQFTGGADVTPALYMEQNTDSHCDPRRDLYEVGVHNWARANCIPMTGICRGGQFLNVMCGGKMLQHIVGDRHCRGDHEARDTLTDEVFQVTSTHHQMMIPHENGQVILRGNIAGHFEDVEAVFYDDERVFCFQPHPEYVKKGRFVDYYFECLERFLEIEA